MQTLKSLIIVENLDPGTPNGNDWREYSESQLDSPVEKLCSVKDGINRADIYLVKERDGYEGLVLANYGAGSQMSESREAWLDGLGDHDRAEVIGEYPEVAEGTMFAKEEDANME